MKKIISILLVVIILMVTLVSCDGKEQTTNPTTSTTNQDPIVPPEEKYSEGLEFTLNSDGKSYIVTGIGTCTDVDLIIPGTYKDLPVLAIGENAFKGNTDIKSLSTGKSVTTICAYAFQNCTSLETLYLGDSFLNIEEYAFENCFALANLYGGKNFKEFPLTAFYYCAGLANIVIDEENPYFKSIDGSFYSKDGKTLIRYAVGKKDDHFTIPEHVTTIGEQSFYGAVNLKSITLPSALESIGSLAFGYCTSLESIRIPATVKSIGSGAFAGSKLLLQVFYDGTLQEWEQVSKFYWATSMGEYTVFCTDASINYLGWVVIYSNVTPAP